MCRCKTLDATVIYQARKRSLHGPVPTSFHGVAVDFLPCGKRFCCGEMNMTPVADPPVNMVRTVVADQTQQPPAAPHQRKAARKVRIVIQVLPLVDYVNLPTFSYGAEGPLLVSARFFQPTGTGLPYSLGDRSESAQIIIRQKQVSHLTLTNDRYQRLSGSKRQTDPPYASIPIANAGTGVAVGVANLILGTNLAIPHFRLTLVPLSQTVTPSANSALLRLNLPLGSVWHNCLPSCLVVEIAIHC